MAADTAPDLTLPTAARQHFDAAITMHADIWDTPVSAKGAGPTGDGSRPWITCLSGGADSTALALLADDHARRGGRAHSTIIIDHAIRPEAAQEAARVASRMQAAGIAVSVHKVEAVAPETGIQAWARAQRYAIATDIARRSGAALLLGQHAGDQAETVWMRLQRGSGLAGLGGMRAVDWRGGVPLLRPLLGFFRHELEAVCQQAGCGWETDPSNNDRRFERVRARAALASLSGMDSQLRRLAAAASTIDDHLMAAVAASQQAVQLATDGSAMLDRSVLALPQAVFRRVLSRATQIIGGNPHPPTHAALDRLHARLQAGNASTLGTCRFRPVAGQG
ncbi:MAG: tRNA lysidine(34) synthetase TilS, partial [SAR116 cluster bacterium]|nr:tRNA lysidine(34) synthetase TilS [SAR116 cluster bacterium]